MTGWRREPHRPPGAQPALQEDTPTAQEALAPQPRLPGSCHTCAGGPGRPGPVGDRTLQLNSHRAVDVPKRVTAGPSPLMAQLQSPAS